jgi:hypothetical protein
MNDTPTAAPAPEPSSGAPDPAPVTVSFASGIFGAMEGILKSPPAFLQTLLRHERRAMGLQLLAIITVCMVAFGLVLASFSGGAQWLWAPLKMTAGLLLSSLLCLPSLYVFGCLSGLSIRPVAAVAVLLAMLSLCGLVVLGFAPVAWIFAQSTDSIVFIGLLVFMMWVIALWFAFGLVGQAARLLGATALGHIRIWLAIFAIVTLQMSTTLRPILGTSTHVLSAERKFFFEHWWETLNSQASAEQSKPASR